VQSEKLRADNLALSIGFEKPDFRDAQLTVALRLASFSVRQLDFNNEVRRCFQNKLVCCRLAFLECINVGVHALADEERAVRLKPRARRLAFLPVSGGSKARRSTPMDSGRLLYDSIKRARYAFVQTRGRHQADQPAHRIKAGTAELATPVKACEAFNSLGIGLNRVNRGAERAGKSGGGSHRVGAHAHLPPSTTNCLASIRLPLDLGGTASKTSAHTMGTLSKLTSTALQTLQLSQL